jgi:excisionase family DNA binding protein
MRTEIFTPSSSDASASTTATMPSDSDEPGAPADKHHDISRKLAAPGDEVVDVVTVARLLRVGRNAIYTLVARNAIPHRRVGKQIRFHRQAVMRWLASWSSQGAKEGH